MAFLEKLKFTSSNKKDIEANDPATSITLLTELRLYDTPSPRVTRIRVTRFPLAR